MLELESTVSEDNSWMSIAQGNALKSPFLQVHNILGEIHRTTEVLTGDPWVTRVDPQDVPQGSVVNRL